MQVQFVNHTSQMPSHKSKSLIHLSGINLEASDKARPSVPAPFTGSKTGDYKNCVVQTMRRQPTHSPPIDK